MRFSTFPLVITALVAAGLSGATPLNTRADQTIILPLSGDPFGSPFEFEFADESRTADSTSTLHITLQNATYSAVIADKLAFSATSPDRAFALLTVPHAFVPGLYDLVVEEVAGDDSIIYTGEVTDLELLSQSQD
uniref:Phosphate:H symporter (Phosphate:H symporter, variant) n=1 Tax=Ganoderma boninense TaxID=34458 RepID=A0A5K1K6G6_9APHY|nr:Phosphate:H symporter (Phosphate:H symporter, variant) [Ganoderma boninense]